MRSLGVIHGDYSHSVSSVSDNLLFGLDLQQRFEAIHMEGEKIKKQKKEKNQKWEKMPSLCVGASFMKIIYFAFVTVVSVPQKSLFTTII